MLSDDVANSASPESYSDEIRLSLPYQSTEPSPSPVPCPTAPNVEDEEGLVESFKNMSLKQAHYLGRSSGLSLIKTAMAIKQDYSEPNIGSSPNTPLISVYNTEMNIRHPEFWDSSTVSILFYTTQGLNDHFTVVTETDTAIPFASSGGLPGPISHGATS